MNMEDAHVAEVDIEEGVSIFGVFDGHGGPEVAKFCAKYFIPKLKENENFKAKNYELALKENYLKMDEILMTPNGAELLKEFKLEQDNMVSLAGCTANVVLVTPDKIYIANAGDARAILYTRDG
eukprot:TRINITY_DN13972_c0_g1_i1.p1 TRINITY_DN13972_c0_g1~~TRINITY_DN13972_c0_g1_i1.p1  ORF type:complete len:124 (-),score=17.10 TRINITY_DN13972_c0_g1_i1:312-683(-)